MSLPLEPETAPIWLWGHGGSPLRQSLAGSEEVDVLVVGAGLAGTAAAYFVATLHPHLSVLLVDASHVGAGATGRCTGIVGPGLSAPLRAMRRRYGDAVTAHAFASTVHGAAEIAALIATERIDCDTRAEPQWVCAQTDGQQRRIRQHTADLADLGFPVQWLGRRALQERLGGSFKAGFSYDDVLLVDPYRLVNGLADAAQRRGVRIFERTRVTRLEPAADHIRAHTAVGAITAKRVLLAVDGYAEDLNPHPASVIPLRSHVVATSPLTPAQHASLGWNGSGGVIDQRNFFSYYRMGAGNRLIFGGGPALLSSGDPQHDARCSTVVFRRLVGELHARFPSLRHVPVDARWSGLTGGTLDRLPVVGTVDDPRISSAGGWCGHGLAMCVATARMYGEEVGARSAPSPVERLPWLRSSAPGLPSAPLRSTALPAYLAVMDLRDRVALAVDRRRDTGHRRGGAPDVPSRQPLSDSLRRSP